MKREFLKSLTVGEQELPKELIDAIMAENGKDIEAQKALTAAEAQKVTAANDTIKQLQDTEEVRWRRRGKAQSRSCRAPAKVRRRYREATARQCAGGGSTL